MLEGRKWKRDRGQGAVNKKEKRGRQKRVRA